MRTLYLDCTTGATGEMIIGALLELIDDRTEFLDSINMLGLGGAAVIAKKVSNEGTTATQIMVNEEDSAEYTHPSSSSGKKRSGLFSPKTKSEHHHHHHHQYSRRSLADVKELIEPLDLPDNVKKRAVSVYNLLADAESHARKVSPQELHFREEGRRTAIIQVLSVCMLMDIISPEEVIVSSVTTGCGQIQKERGVFDIPTPTTEYILEGISTSPGNEKGEYCNAIGAALLRTFATGTGDMPHLLSERKGSGMGRRELGAVHCLYAYYGTSDTSAENSKAVDMLKPTSSDSTGKSSLSFGEKSTGTYPQGGQKKRFVLSDSPSSYSKNIAKKKNASGARGTTELICHSDSVTAEKIVYVMSQLASEGAENVYCVPTVTPKGDTGYMLSCTSDPAMAYKVIARIHDLIPDSKIMERSVQLHYVL